MGVETGSDTPARLRRAQVISLALYVISLATAMSGMEIFSTLLTLLFLPSLIWFVPRPWPQIPLLRPIALFVAIAVVGILLSDSGRSDKLYDLGRMRFFLWYVVLFLYLHQADPTRLWIRCLWVTTLVVGVYGFIQHFVAIDWIRPEGKKVLLYAIQDEKIGPLVVGTFNHHLTFSNIYLFYACLFLSVGFALKRWGMMVLHGAFLFLLCFWTESRAAWVAIPVCVTVILGYHRRRFLWLAPVGLALFLVALYGLDPGFRQRLNRTFSGDDFWGGGPRYRLWSAQWEMFKDHPWLGVGYNNNERFAKTYVDRLYPNRTNFYGHAHSTVLQILTTTGIFGFLAFIWLWIQVFVLCHRCARSPDLSIKGMGVGLLAAFLGFHIQGLTQWNFGDAEVLHNVIFFWAVISVIAQKNCLRTNGVL